MPGYLSSASQMASAAFSISRSRSSWPPRNRWSSRLLQPACISAERISLDRSGAGMTVGAAAGHAFVRVCAARWRKRARPVSRNWRSQRNLATQKKHTAAAMVGSETLRVATLNLRFLLDQWRRRAPLYEAALEAEDADVVALQEVSCGGWRGGQTGAISARLPGRETFSSPNMLAYLRALPLVRFLVDNPLAALLLDVCAWINGWTFEPIFGRHAVLLYSIPVVCEVLYVLTGAAWLFGNALLVRKSLRPGPRDEALLGTGWRTAVMTHITTASGKTFCVVCAHLTHEAGSASERLAQFNRLVRWVDERARDADGVILMGDFNASPEEPLYALAKASGFESAFAVDNGAEPECTFHQNHMCPTKDIGPELCLDYIFFRGALKVKSKTARLFANTPDTADATLYPSDHYGVRCEFLVQ
eukprot:m.15391 g.15391  ORF g.15391 m.15391 type:complete len:418 (+) comp3433_c0_seq2:634-1887(+)